MLNDSRHPSYFQWCNFNEAYFYITYRVDSLQIKEEDGRELYSTKNIKIHLINREKVFTKIVTMARFLEKTIIRIGI